MFSGVEQYGQCSGHWEESSAISVDGLGGCIDHESSLRHGVEQLVNVVAKVGAVVARRQQADDVVDGALPVAQLEHFDRGRIEPHDAFGDQQHVLLAHVVVAKSCAGGEAGTRHAAGSGGCVSPRSMASSCAHSTSVLKRSAATAASCCSPVRQRSTVRSSAYCAWRGACTSRVRKYSSPAGSIHP